MTNWTDLFGDLTLAETIAWIAALTVIVVFAIRGWKLLGSLKDFMDDIRGEDARPGVPARPGLMVRLSSLEERSQQTGDKVDEMSVSLAEVRHEVLPNTGTSLNDAVSRTEKAVEVLTRDMAVVHKKLDNDNRRLGQLTDVAMKNHPNDIEDVT